jgi:hypothetical protein
MNEAAEPEGGGLTAPVEDPVLDDPDVAQVLLADFRVLERYDNQGGTDKNGGKGLEQTEGHADSLQARQGTAVGTNKAAV